MSAAVAWRLLLPNCKTTHEVRGLIQIANIFGVCRMYEASVARESRMQEALLDPLRLQYLGLK